MAAEPGDEFLVDGLPNVPQIILNDGRLGDGGAHGARGGLGY